MVNMGLDELKVTLAVFIDLRKAFDTVDHEILIKKCEAMGIPREVKAWLESYLLNRSQVTTVNGLS